MLSSHLKVMGFIRRLVFKFPPGNQATLILTGVSTPPLLYRVFKPTTLLFTVSFMTTLFIEG